MIYVAPVIIGERRIIDMKYNDEDRLLVFFEEDMVYRIVIYGDGQEEAIKDIVEGEIGTGNCEYDIRPIDYDLWLNENSFDEKEDMKLFDIR